MVPIAPGNLLVPVFGKVQSILLPLTLRTVLDKVVRKTLKRDNDDELYKYD
jgi:hypothetical protein